MVDEVRASEAFIPELSLVWEEDGAVLGLSSSAAGTSSPGASWELRPTTSASASSTPSR